ncbi:MAG TPA: DUF1802 family protein [Fimbriiglobus sp.]|jgi:hypothetical protein
MTVPDPPVAFKEWAAVCRALALGIQTVILRKGGIAEEGGTFRPEHPRFWLYPTYYHEPQVGGIRPEYFSLLTEAEADRPPAETVRLTHVAEVTAVQFLDSIDAALSLHSRHILAEAAVRKRFFYRNPGLYVIDVRIAVAGPIEIRECPAFAGCKTWVRLGNSLRSSSS